MKVHGGSWGWLVLCLLTGLVAHPATAQPGEGSPASDTQLELVLDQRTIEARVPPLPAASGASDRPVRVAQLEIDATIEIGEVTIEFQEPERRELISPATYDLWLTRGESGSVLEVAEAQDEAATAPGRVLGTVPLTHETSETPSAILVGSLLALGGEDARLTLNWGPDAWSTGLRFPVPREDPPRRRRPDGVAEARDFEFDSTPMQRASRLGRRNMVTVTLPGGSRVFTVYPKALEVDGRDFAHLVSVAVGDVVRLTDGAVIRLDTEVPLQFDDLRIDIGNLGLPEAPGAYGVWLKRAPAGWRLVFNDEPDAWGTQHDPVYDVGEIELAYAQDMDDPSRALAASVVMTASDRGRLVLVWGPHTWSADFAVEQ